MFHRVITPLVLLGCQAMCCACGCEKDTPPLPTVDTTQDPDADPVPDPTVDSTPVDTTGDTDVADTGVDGDAVDGDVVAPTCPPDGDLGTPCAEDGDCAGGRCIVERNQGYDGETYRMWVGGYCADGTWSAGCDPADVSGCGPGSRCVHLGTILCEDRWACMDACAYADPSGVPYDQNACCRTGYRCDALWQVCVPGCSNDRQCCEVWTDDDGDDQRDAGEVVLDTTCDHVCSPDTFGCVGGSSGDWTSECTLDAHCPPGGTCLTQKCSNTLAESFEGGLCVGFGCTLDPEGCVEAGGGCTLDPSTSLLGAVCVAPCSTGVAPGDPESDCRDGYGCMPVCSSGWVGELPPEGRDGYCWPARGTGAAPESMYEPCTDDDQCASELGLGVCETRLDASYCSRGCNGGLAMDDDVCGAVISAGDPAPGVCWECLCRKACTDTAAALAEGPCDAASTLACYPLAELFGVKAWTAGGAEPPGLCLPACATSTDCQVLWGIGYDCDLVTGRCLF